MDDDRPILIACLRQRQPAIERHIPHICYTDETHYLVSLAIDWTHRAVVPLIRTFELDAVASGPVSAWTSYLVLVWMSVDNHYYTGEYHFDPSEGAAHVTVSRDGSECMR